MDRTKTNTMLGEILAQYDEPNLGVIGETIEALQEARAILEPDVDSVDPAIKARDALEQASMAASAGETETLEVTLDELNAWSDAMSDLLARCQKVSSETLKGVIEELEIEEAKL